MRALPAKRMGETITVEFNFADVLLWGETISEQSVSVEVLSGADAAPSRMLEGTASVSGSVVYQNITEGLGGVIYNLVATASGSLGGVYTKLRKLAVITDDGSYAPGGTLSLTGDLPGGIANVPYSETLDIHGGYLPYDYDDIVAGAAPFWMGFSISGAQLVCAGIPDETVTTTYDFTPQILDGANNTASSIQQVEITHVAISGDMPDGYISESISGAYSQTDGELPVTYAITSGTFPAGLTFNADGTYEGTFTTQALYTWEVTVTDAVGNTATIQDTCAVARYVMGPQTAQAALIYTHEQSCSRISNNQLECIDALGNIAVGNDWLIKTFDDDLNLISTTTVTVETGSPGDSRFTARGFNSTYQISSDGNYGYCEVWNGGDYVIGLQPTGTALTGWWYNENGYFPEYGGLVWFVGSGTVYIGVRKVGNTGIVYNKIFKWNISASLDPAIPAVSTSPVVTAGSYFYVNVDRQNIVRAIALTEAELITYSSSLNIVSTVALSMSLAGLQAFCVDSGNLIIYRNNVPDAGMYVYDLATQTLIDSFAITGGTYHVNNKLLATDGSFYLQSGVYLKRFSYIREEPT